MTLYQLSPYGLGSPAVESFHSFLIRFASLHALSVNELRTLILSRYAGDARCMDERVRSEYAIQNLSHLVRPTGFNRQLVEHLQEATGLTSLSEMTFLALGDEFGRQKRVFRDSIAWCPLCFAEQSDSGQSCHLHLTWAVRDYSVCHLHACEMLDRCSNCGSRQNSLRMRNSIGECGRCGMSLIAAGVTHPAEGKEGFYVQDLVDLVGGINEHPNQALSQKAAQGCVDQLFSEVWRREEEKQLWEMIPRDECISIVCGEKELTLPVLRRVAYRLGVDLYQILSGRLEPITKALDPSWLMELPANLRPRPKRRRICREKLLQRLVAARDSFEAPPPLSALSKAVKTTTGAIEYHFPAFASEIKSAHQRLLSERRQQNEEIGRMLVFKHLAASPGVSRKSAQRFLSSKSALSKNQIRSLVARYVPPAGRIHSVG